MENTVPNWLKKPSDANELNTTLWPTSVVRNARGEVEIASVPVTKLAEEFGTPLYVYDEAMFRERAKRIRTVFENAFAGISTPVKIYYAGKAFLSTTIVRWMLDAGLNIDTSTEGELSLALIAQADPGRIGLHGNNKSDREIEIAVASQIGAIVIDGESEIDRIGNEAKKRNHVQPVRLRVRSGVHASTHEFLATAHEDQKFGVSFAEAPELVKKIQDHPHLKFLGLHSHIGSQIFDASGFEASIQQTLTLHQQLLEFGEIPEINFGGGFGIAYTEQDTPEDIEQIAENLAAAFARTVESLGITDVPAVAFEPGRWISGPAGVTLYRVGETKRVQLAAYGEQSTRRYVSVDGGMSDNIRSALYGADYRSRLLSRESEAAAVLSRVVGKHCESGDIVVNDDFLPEDLTSGDILGVAATGAYCYSLASNYNFVPKPAVVAVKDGEAKLLVYRETVAELLGRDAGADDDE